VGIHAATGQAHRIAPSTVGRSIVARIGLQGRDTGNDTGRKEAAMTETGQPLDRFEPGRVEAGADAEGRMAVASVDLAAPPERVFQALASDEITRWWVRPGVFDTREWTGELRVGGAWRGAGMFRDQPYALDGEYLEIDRPRRLVHTWRTVGSNAAASTVTYQLEPMEGGTRLTLTHGPFGSAQALEGNSIGWRTSFEALAGLLYRAEPQGRAYPRR